jgi:glycosyltransferase involved in cell wall biosynthesis
LDIEYAYTWNFLKRTRHFVVGVGQEELLPVPLGLPAILMRAKPDIIISSVFGLRSILAYFVARLMKVPIILWSESTIEHSHSISKLQRLIRRFLSRRADYFLAWGRCSVAYLQQLGVGAEKIEYCAQAVDNDLWANRVSPLNKAQIRSEFEVTGKVFLAVGRLLERKGFDLFLRAWDALPIETKRSNTVIIVGDGPEEKRLKEIAAHGEFPNLFFVCNKPPEELAKYYALADLFVFPSLVDVWGLVVNEALACGVPVLASKYAGVSQELVGDTGAGELFDPLDHIGFTSALRRWCEKTDLPDSTVTWDAVENCNFGVTINAFKRVVEYACYG